MPLVNITLHNPFKTPEGKDAGDHSLWPVAEKKSLVDRIIQNLPAEFQHIKEVAAEKYDIKIKSNAKLKIWTFSTYVQGKTLYFAMI